MSNDSRTLCLDYLRRHRIASRAELAAALGLPRKTASSLVELLLQDKLIVEAGRRESEAGRREELFGINGAHSNYVGLDLGATHVTGILVDANGSKLDRMVFDIRPGLGVEMILQQMKSVAARMVDSPLKTAPIAGAGVCVPGFVDPETGVSILAENIVGWRDVHLAGKLRSVLNVPFFLEDSSRALGIAERWSGSLRHTRNFVVLDVGYGVGMAIFLSGELYTGAGYKSGEIGHTTVVPDGAWSASGKRGCLETVASGKAIAEQARAAVLEGKSAILRDLVKGDVSSISAADVSVAANLGDTISAGLFGAAGRCIGIALANTVNLLNPSHVVLGGGLINAGVMLLDDLRASLTAHTMTQILDETVLSVSELGVDGSAQGAAIMAIQRVSSDPI